MYVLNISTNKLPINVKNEPHKQLVQDYINMNGLMLGVLAFCFISCHVRLH